MTEVSISVLNDPETADAAIIRLTGVALLPPGSTFRITPIDDGVGDALPDGWPAGDLKPVRQRITSDGVDLLMGPDVLTAPGLLPGTPVTITVDSVGARGELRWPTLPLPKPEPRQRRVVTAERLARELAERAEAEKSAAEAAARAKETAAPSTNLKGADDIAQPEAPADGAAKATAAPPVFKTADARRGHAQPRGRSWQRHRGSAAARCYQASRRHPAACFAQTRTLVAATSGSQQQGCADKHLAGHATAPTPPTPAVARRGATSSGDADARTKVASPAAARAAAMPQQTSGRSQARLVLPFLAGLGVAIVAGMLLGKLPRPVQPPSRLAGVQRTEAERIDVLGPGLEQLGHILDLPDTSPLGRPAQGVNLDEALRLADKGLYGPAQERNRAEAKYWLRKALSEGLGDRRLLWALTQLGTLYAKPEQGEPDYAAARELWRIAAAKGDGVAMCFLASLAEHGLGMAADRQQALGLYRAAKAMGGCRDVDAAIARLKKDAP
ncbi:MAG: tetratricopeptide repeat protein [Hyphomicrobiaceae bacterium]